MICNEGTKIKRMYLESVNLAVSLGYKAVQDPHAFKGISYIKNDLKWIHDIEALKLKFRPVETTEGLRALGYSVDDYFTYQPNGMVEIYNSLSDCADDDGLVYLEGGMSINESGEFVER